MKVLFFFSRIEHARMWRRVRRLQSSFDQVTVVGFRRASQKYPSEQDGIVLADIKDRRYFRRLIQIALAILKCRDLLKHADIGYGFTMDAFIPLYVASLLTRKRVRLYFELADIRPIMTRRSIVGRTLRFLERYLVDRCECVIFTSEAFYSGYFRDVQRKQDFRHIVIEHKPEVDPAVRDFISIQRVSKERIIIGYFGVIRCKSSFETLLKLAERYTDKFKVVMRGVFDYPLDSEYALRRISETEGVEYLGAYKSPEQLYDVYTAVDIVWDAYHEGDNAKWQRTTRFSEACFFKRPVIYCAGTQDGKIAEEHRIGFPIELGDVDRTLSALEAITDEKLSELAANISKLPEYYYLYQREYEELITLMKHDKTDRGIGCPAWTCDERL